LRAGADVQGSGADLPPGAVVMPRRQDTRMRMRWRGVSASARRPGESPESADAPLPAAPAAPRRAPGPAVPRRLPRRAGRSTRGCLACRRGTIL